MKCVYLVAIGLVFSTIIDGMDTKPPVAPSVPVRLQLYDQTKLTSYRTITVPLTLVDLCTTLKEMRTDFGEKPLPITSAVLTYADWQVHMHLVLNKLASKQDIRSDMQMRDNNALKKIAHVATFLNCKNLEDAVLDDVARRFKLPATIKQFVEKPDLVSSEFALNSDQEKIIARKMINHIWFCAHTFDQNNGRKNARIRSVNFSADGKYLVSGSEDKLIKIFDMSSRSCIHTFVLNENTPLGWENEVMEVRISPDNNHIAAKLLGGSLRVFDVQTKQCVTYHTPADSFCFSPNSNHLVFGFRGILKNFDLLKKQYAQDEYIFDQPNGIYSTGVKDVCFSPDGKYLVASADNRSIKIFDAATKECRLVFDQSNGGYAQKGYNIYYGEHSLHVSPDSKYILSTHGGIIKIFDIEKQECIHTIDETNGASTNIIKEVCFGPNGNEVIARSSDGEIRVFGLLSGRLIKVVPVNYGCNFSPDGQYLVSGLDDGSIDLYKKPIATNTVEQAFLLLCCEQDNKPSNIKSHSTLARIYNNISDADTKNYIGSLL